MSSIILSSNSNSAILNTLEASDSAANNLVYSTPAVNPFYASTWMRIEKSSGSATSGGEMSFTVSKAGVVEQCLFSFTRVYAVADFVPVGYIFDAIEAFELLSGSAVASTITSEGLAAMFSDLSEEQYNPIFKSCIQARTSALKHTFTIPIHFGMFSNRATMLQSTFLEPLSIRIKWRQPLVIYGEHALSGTDPIERPALHIRYAAYDESTIAQTLVENYSQAALNTVAMAQYREAPITHLQTGGDGVMQTVKIDLQNSQAISCLYIVVTEFVAERDKDNLGTARTPIAVSSVLLTASGQEVCNLDETQLAYGRLDKSGWSTSVSSQNDTGGLFNVTKVQFGTNTMHGEIPNALSLRQVNAPTVTITFKATIVGANVTAANRLYKVTVVEDALNVMSTTSATGRYGVSLAN
jgi:hypothetical protein